MCRHGERLGQRQKGKRQKPRMGIGTEFCDSQAATAWLYLIHVARSSKPTELVASIFFGAGRFDPKPAKITVMTTHPKYLFGSCFDQLVRLLPPHLALAASIFAGGTLPVLAEAPRVLPPGKTPDDVR